MLFDTHVHFDSYQDAGESSEVVERAENAGVRRLIAVGGSPEANRAALAVARQFPRTVRAAIGYDRSQAQRPQDPPASADQVLEGLGADRPEVVAIGEIGLDFHYSPGTSSAQIDLFHCQLLLAARIGLPVIVHSRDADRETLTELRRYRESCRHSARIGVLHCFTGGQDFAEQLIELGFDISFSGILTFRNAVSLRETARRIPGDRLLVETDSPYLAPVPHRGKRNEPAYLPSVAAALAEVRGCSIEAIAEATTANAERLFTPGSPSA